MLQRLRIALVLLTALATLCFVAPAMACSVPVFRYALERWTADFYHVFIFTRGPLEGEAKQVAELLENNGPDAEKPVNVSLHVVDLDGEVSAEFKKLWEAEKTDQVPWMVVRYPIWSQIPVPVWSGKPSVQVAKSLIDSPARQEIVKRITKGHSAVWVFLKSGDKKKDEAKLKLLTEQLKKLEKELTRRAPVAVDPEMFGPETPFEKIRIKFSILSIARDDPAERMFVKMLLRTEEDLEDYKNEPITFPVFGRGRALYALVGDGINEDNIVETCAFLVGDCSCQIKAMCPGTDLIFAANWDELVMGELMSEEPVPELIGLGEFAAEAEEGQELREDATTSADGGKEPAEAEAKPASAAQQSEHLSADGPVSASETSNQKKSEQVAAELSSTDSSDKGEPEQKPKLRPQLASLPQPAGSTLARRTGQQELELHQTEQPYDTLVWTLAGSTAVIVLVVIIGTVFVLYRRP